MEHVLQLIIFSVKSVVLVVSILCLVAGIVAITSKQKSKEKGKLKINKLNEQLQQLAQHIEQAVLDKKELKQRRKAQRKQQKEQASDRSRIFVLQFKGDMKASAVDNLRQEITALLQVARPHDEVVLRLESGGGLVSSYGLAASQLTRIKDQNIKLTVCIDQVAASGGYLMACVADQILAAPFAIIGSIGVVAQLPNFHRLLKKNHIDLELHTAGQYKRTLTLFGENTDDARNKFREDLEEIHTIFKNFIAKHRPMVDLSQAANGEHWLATDAMQLQLVDRLCTSDEYLYSMYQNDRNDILELTFESKRTMMDKLLHQGASLWQQLLLHTKAIT